MSLGTEGIIGSFSNHAENGNGLMNPNHRPVRVSKLMFVAVPGTHDLVRRPMEINSNITQDDLIEMGQIVNDPNTTMMGFKQKRLTRVANNILQISANYEGYANIQNGWLQPRLRFIMVVDEDNGFGGSVKNLLVGYTDYIGTDVKGNVDPQMRMYVTSSFKMRPKTMTDPRSGIVRSVSLLTQDHILTNPNITNSLGTNHEYLSASRIAPVDVYKAASVLNDYGFSTNGHSISMGHSILDHQVRTASRTNIISNEYMGNVLNAYRTATAKEESASGIDDYGSATKYDSLIQQTEETSLPTQKFFKIMSYGTDILSSGSFTFGDLRKEFPEVDMNAVTTVQYSKKLISSNSDINNNLASFTQYQLGEVERWDSRFFETMLAHQISMMLPSLMINHLITDIRFSCTNQTTNFNQFGYAWDFNVQSANLATASYQNPITFITQLTQEMEMNMVTSFKLDFETYVMGPMSDFNNIGLNVFVDIRLEGDAYIAIQLDGGQIHKYHMPSFADSLISPLVTTNQQHFNNFVMDVYKTADTIISSTS